MNKTYAIYLPVDGEPEMIEFEGHKGNRTNLDWYYEKIGCDYIEATKTIMDNKKKLVIDEEGWLKPEPQLNMIASILYGSAEHGQTIVGNAILCDTAMTPDGEDFVGMSEDVATMAMKRLEGISKILRMIRT